MADPAPAAPLPADGETGPTTASRSAFLAAASHELRTPLNGLLGVAQLLAQSELTANQRAHVEAIRSSGEALLGLVNDILDMAELDAGRIEPARAPFDPEALVQSVVELMAPRAREKRLDIAAWRAADVPAEIVGDGPRLRQVLFNLVGNALKFTETGGVEVRARTAPGDRGRLRIEVRDTGPGVAPADRERIFEEFARADDRREGSGLGLAISRRIARALGGDIFYEPADGGGSVFAVEVAIEAASDAASPDPALAGVRAVVAAPPITTASILGMASSLGVDARRHDADAPADAVLLWDRSEGTRPPLRYARSVVLLDGTERSEAEDLVARGAFNAFLLKPVRAASLAAALADRPAAAAPPRVASPGAARRAPGDGDAAAVLLAEDNDINALLATAVLQQRGHRVRRVENGEKALAALAEETFDIVLMDMRMPVMDGLEATRALRERGDATPVVAMTANALETDRVACIQAGMDDFLAKPFEPADLHAMIARRRRKGARESAAG